MKKIMAIALLLSLAFFMAAPQEKKDKKKDVKEVTVTGEIIDVKCYVTGMQGGMGEDHKQCAIDCIKGGLPVGILDQSTNKLLVVVPKAGMMGANEELLPHVAQKVKLTGIIAEKGGQKVFIYTKVEEAK